MKVRVLLVDDHREVRAGLRGLLEKDAGIEVVGEASGGLMALSLVKSLAPDVVAMDVAMPGMNGIEATRLISAEFENVMVVGISTYSDRSYVDSMLDAGACGYVLKIEAHDALVPAVHAAHSAGALARTIQAGSAPPSADVAQRSFALRAEGPTPTETRVAASTPGRSSSPSSDRVT